MTTFIEYLLAPIILPAVLLMMLFDLVRGKRLECR